MAKFHETLLPITARTPSKYVALFNDPFIPNPARAPSY
jgi:hypothetical protein